MILLCDVGGTHIRFAHHAPGRDAQAFRKNKVSGFATLEEAMQWYLAHEKMDAERVSHFYLAFSNRNDWVVDPKSIAQVLPRASFTHVNDFEANAFGIPSLNADGVLTIRDKGDVPPGSSACLLGPGTGLGLAYVIYDGHGHGMVQRTHGGHMAPVCFSPEHETIMAAMQDLKPSKTMPIFEDVISGPGLHRVYRVLCARANQDPILPDAHAIVSETDNPICKEAIRIFLEFTGAFAGQAVSYAYSYRGVYLTGGVIDRIFEQNAFQKDAFFRFFTNNPVPIVAKHLNATPVYWIKDEFISLKGLSLYASRAAHD